MKSIAIFGGTFDPVHKAHINTALNIQNKLQFDDFRFLPCYTPALKKGAHATAEQRLDMLKEALRAYPQFTIDCRELKRQGASYMIDTLISMRHEHPHDSLSLIMGMDAFAHFERWHRWQEILSLSHIVIMSRPGYSEQDLSKTLGQLIIAHRCLDTADLKQRPYGSIYQINAGVYDISSTEVRQSSHDSHSMEDVPDRVLEYIKNHHLYKKSS